MVLVVPASSVVFPILADGGASEWSEAIAGSVVFWVVLAFLSTVFVSVVVSLLLVRLRARATAGRETGEAARLLDEVRAVERGLREFAGEVEERFDRKLDRLQALLGDSGTPSLRAALVDPREEPSDGVDALVSAAVGCARVAAGCARVAVAFPSSGMGRAETAASAAQRSSLGAGTREERDRVLALAAFGKAPQEISDSVGLPLGEVDLILRIHRRSGGLLS